MTITYRVWTERGVRHVKARNSQEAWRSVERLAHQIYTSFETKRPAFVEMIDTFIWQEIM